MKQQLRCRSANLAWQFNLSMAKINRSLLTAVEITGLDLVFKLPIQYLVTTKHFRGWSSKAHLLNWEVFFILISISLYKFSDLLQATFLSNRNLEESHTCKIFVPLSFTQRYEKPLSLKLSLCLKKLKLNLSFWGRCQKPGLSIS